MLCISDAIIKVVCILAVPSRSFAAILFKSVIEELLIICLRVLYGSVFLFRVQFLGCNIENIPVSDLKVLRWPEHTTNFDKGTIREAAEWPLKFGD